VIPDLDENEKGQVSKSKDKAKRFANVERPGLVRSS
jgi:hypothetical protein